MSDVLPRLTTALESKYRVTRQIGVGGMATVYLAHDIRHERDVAIKVLHPDLAAALGAERFLAEIKTTAKLQHPHILPLLDSGAADGLLYYVMPYVAGESLRTRLERETQLAVDDAVRIAREVASAIESAHKHGVVHRDIKPENILLHEDQALVADFGIALAVSAAGGVRMTQTGLSLGTPQYMAPEQAMGERAIDGRADIYALGAVLYEMLVGEAPFTGPTVQAIVARVMTESPRAVTGQRKSVPAHVNAAVLKALEKLPADRFHSAADFSKALIAPDFSGRQATTDGASALDNRARSPLRHPALPWVLAGVAALAALLLLPRAFSSRESAKPIRLSVDLPAEMMLVPNTAEMLAISDDGSTIAIGVVVGGQTQLALRRLDEDKLRLVPGSANATGGTAFSADGKWIVFGTNEKLFKAPVSGGPATVLASSRWAQTAWVGNEAVIYTKNYDSGLNRVSADGGDTTVLTTPDRQKGELGHWWPQVLPDGDHVLFTRYLTPPDRSTIEVLSLQSGKRQVVLNSGYFGRYVDGHLLFTRNSTVMAVPFDFDELRVKGTPSVVPLEIEIEAANGWAGFAVSRTGTFVYRADVLKNMELSWSDENGNEERALDSAGRYTAALASPDGRKIAVVRDGDVWVYDRQRGIFSRVTQTDQVEVSILWTPDSREIVYGRDVPQYDIFKRAVDGSSPEELVVTSSKDKRATGITTDGKFLMYQGDYGSGDDIYLVSLDAAGRTAPRVLIGGAGSQDDARMSPDGQWVIYTSVESGRTEVYLVPYPLDRGPARQQLSVAGSTYAVWGSDGRTVFYDAGGQITRVRIDPRTGEIGKPELMRRLQAPIGWTIGPDGRFLIGKIAQGGERRPLKVILNWVSTLRNN